MLTNRLAWLGKFSDFSRSDSFRTIEIIKLSFIRFNIAILNLIFIYMLIKYLQFINDLHALISPTAPGTPLPIVLLGKVHVLWSYVSFRAFLLTV